MRLFLNLLTWFLILTTLLTGCSTETTVEESAIELVSAYAEISNDTFDDIEIMEGDRKGQFYQLTSLDYHFILNNTGNETLGGMEKMNRKMFRFDDGLELSIEPNDKLKKVLQEVLGIDDFGENPGYGIGRSGMPKIEPGGEEKYILYIVLGATIEDQYNRLAPPREQLDMLERNCMEATLVISIENEEIVRFDLVNPK